MGLFRRFALPGRRSQVNPAPGADGVTASGVGEASARLRPIPAAERKAVLELLNQEHLMTWRCSGRMAGRV